RVAPSLGRRLRQRTASLNLKRGNIWQLGGGSGDARPIFDGNLLRHGGCGGCGPPPPHASQHQKCRSPPLLRSEAHVASVYKADRASGIERVGIENSLILHASRAARRLIARRCDDPDRRTAGGGAGRTRRTSGAGRASGAGRSGLALGWLLALPARGQEKGG